MNLTIPGHSFAIARSVRQGISTAGIEYKADTNSFQAREFGIRPEKYSWTVEISVNTKENIKILNDYLVDSAGCRPVNLVGAGDFYVSSWAITIIDYDYASMSLTGET